MNLNNLKPQDPLSVTIDHAYHHAYHMLSNVVDPANTRVNT